MSADVVLDIEELVGELPEIPCEAPEHEASRQHGGPATYYVRLLHNCHGPVGVVALCAPATAFVAGALVDGCGAECTACGWKGKYEEFIQIIGPIRGRASWAP